MLALANDNEGALDRLLEAAANGEPLDWRLLESGAQTDEERERLECLRILGEIAELHRSTGDPFGTSVSKSVNATHHPALAAEVLPDDPAQMWGRYRLLERVGEGSFGSVYRAFDPELRREIAVKILHRHVADHHLKEKLLEEGRWLARVRHANVVSVFGVESHEDRVGLCMEFIPGETLEHVVRTGGTLNPRETVALGQDLCRALAAVHAAGFVHRDVKARNVMREQDGRIVLMDFGTGRESRHEGEEGDGRADTAGTPLYMAPEVLAWGPASPASDVYSVGVLLYHLVTSEYPVQANSVEQLREAHTQGRRRRLSEVQPDLPPRFVRVVERALASDPGERYATAAGLLKELGAVFPDRWTPRAIARRLLAIALFLTVSACVVTALGALTSATFNLTLGRSGFADEPLREVFKWGLRATVLPTLFAMLALLAVGLLVVLRRLLLGLSSTAERLDSLLRRHIGDRMRSLHFNDVSVIASWVLALSGSALVYSWWYFSPLLDAFTVRLSTDQSVAALGRLSPTFTDEHYLYRYALSWLTVLTAAAWYLTVTIAGRKGQRLSLGVRVGGAAILSLSLLSLDWPYRLFQDDKFPVATWNGATCYLIAERADDLLLSCPELPPPRNTIVRKDAEGLHRLDRSSESIFTPFGPSVDSARQP